MALSQAEREANYVRQKLGPDCEFAYGLKYLSGPQRRRIKHKMHREERRARTDGTSSDA